MNKEIMFLENGIKITSVELVKVINGFREIEGKPELLHKNLMRKIRNEIKILEELGISQLNFEPTSYIDTQNKEMSCYLINKEGMLMLLNSESTLVRYKTSEYIKKLETAYLDLKFKRGDKKHQLDCMALFQDKLPEELKKERFPYIIINKFVNQIVSHEFGFPNEIKKNDMNKEMLEEREKVLEDYIKMYEIFGSNRKVKRMLEEKYVSKIELL